MRVIGLIAAQVVLAGLLLGQQMPFVFVPGGPESVTALFQDDTGRLWVGAQGDLACFDGERFYSLRKLGFPGGVTVTSLGEDNEGAIWIGTSGGVYRFEDGALANVTREPVRSLASRSDFVLVDTGSPAKLVRIRRKPKGWEAVVIMPLSAMKPAFSVDSHGQVLISEADGWSEASWEAVARWHPGEALKFQKHTHKYPLSTFARDGDGCLWSRASTVTSYQCPGEAGVTDLPDFLANEVAYFSRGPRNQMLFVNNGGLVYGRPGHFERVTAAQGLPAVTCGITARDGTVWLGNAKGLYRWPHPFRLEYWTAREGFTGYGGLIRSGNAMFSSNAGIDKLDADRKAWRPWGNTKTLGPVYGLFADVAGSVLAGRRFGGVARVGTDGRVGAEAGRPGDGFIKLARDGKGQLWAAGIGVCRVRESGAQVGLECEKAFEGKLILDLEIHPLTGEPWVCGGDGLAYLTADGWRTIDQRAGLRRDIYRSLAIAANGDVWLGYDSEPAIALLRVDAAGRVTVKDFEAAHTMFLDTDTRGRIWRGTDRGVFVAEPEDAAKNQWIRLDEGEGLPFKQTRKQGFYADADGSVWWMGSDSSVTHFAPAEDFARPAAAPDVFVAGFSWDGGAANLGERSALPYGAAVTAHAGSLQFDRRSALRLRYRMLPEQEEWKESAAFDLPLGRIASGRHTFEIQGKLGGGTWSEIRRLSFEEATPFWLGWPFLIVLALAATGGGTGGYFWRQRHRQLARRALPDLSALRADAFAPEARALIGTELDGRYEPKAVVARGGFANVYEGYDRQRKCRCAIKVFHREIADQGLIKRFRQEVEALETVRHPNVVRIYGHGETVRQVPYLVMEFVEGRTLREAIPEDGLPAGEVAKLLRQAGRALEAIHSHGICHRDVKPDNLMIRQGSRELVLIDFSIAIIKSPDKTVHGLSRAAGTIQYMAPEQAVGWADSASDIYSLAKVVIEMLTGKQLSELLPDAARDLPQRVKELLLLQIPALSEAARESISKALEFDPAYRPRDARRFAETIAADLDSEE